MVTESQPALYGETRHDPGRTFAFYATANASKPAGAVPHACAAARSRGSALHSMYSESCAEAHLLQAAVSA